MLCLKFVTWCPMVKLFGLLVLPKHEDWGVGYVLLRLLEMYPLGFTSPPAPTPRLHHWIRH
jgi:hypothetical protein